MATWRPALFGGFGGTDLGGTDEGGLGRAGVGGLWGNFGDGGLGGNLLIQGGASIVPHRANYQGAKAPGWTGGDPGASGRHRARITLPGVSSTTRIFLGIARLRSEVQPATGGGRIYCRFIKGAVTALALRPDAASWL